MCWRICLISTFCFLLRKKVTSGIVESLTEQQFLYIFWILISHLGRTVAPVRPRCHCACFQTLRVVFVACAVWWSAQPPMLWAWAEWAELCREVNSLALLALSQAVLFTCKSTILNLSIIESSECAEITVLQNKTSALPFLFWSL